MKFTLEINMENSAFFQENGEGPEQGPEIARILRQLADRVEGSANLILRGRPLIDINGNAVGGWEVEK